jgi:hypothetical protein
MSIMIMGKVWDSKDDFKRAFKSNMKKVSNRCYSNCLCKQCDDIIYCASCLPCRLKSQNDPVTQCTRNI